MDDEAERNDPYCLSAAQEDALLAGAPWERFAVIGDSIAKGVFEELDGYRPVPWPERVIEALRRQRAGAELLNLARMYATSEQILAEQLDQAVTFQPDLAAVVCGGNDILVSDWDPVRTEIALDSIVARLISVGAEIITFTMFDIVKALDMPPEMGADLDARLSALADLTRVVAQRHGTLHVEMRVHPACSDPSLYASDFQHGSARGQAVAAAGAIHRLGARLLNQPLDGVWPRQYAA